MENLLLKQLREALPQGMRVPSELETLYAWIEANGFYDDAGGRRRGYLYPQDRLKQSWSDDEREGGRTSRFSPASRRAVIWGLATGSTAKSASWTQR